ncbi:hypothetical protein ACET3Z_011654 [Daucus carota]
MPEQLNIQKEESKKKEVHVEDNLCINPLKETELILYGGEFYNGNKTYVYGDLYRYDVDKNEWKLISSPNSPPPRSAHQAVAWKNYLYIYGGEFTSPNQERFHHYKDFWMLDLKTNQWEQLNYKGCPSPRSVPETDAFVYFSLNRLCEGGELLDRILSRGGGYAEDDAKTIIVQILRVVAFCHLQGVVHRDLKPEVKSTQEFTLSSLFVPSVTPNQATNLINWQNFLFAARDEDAPLKIIDFGLSDFSRPVP